MRDSNNSGRQQGLNIPCSYFFHLRNRIYHYIKQGTFLGLAMVLTFFPVFGTGNVVYSQIGLKFKDDLLGEEQGTLQPYASVMYANYERFASAMSIIDIGLNWLIKGHTSKISLDYQHRPVYNSMLERDGYKGQVDFTKSDFPIR